MELKLNEVEVTKLNLAPGDTLAVMIKSDDLDRSALNMLKDNFQRAFPGTKVLLFALGTKDDIKFAAITNIDQPSAPPQATGCSVSSYCADCSCGKKEMYENGDNNANS